MIMLLKQKFTGQTKNRVHQFLVVHLIGIYVMYTKLILHVLMVIHHPMAATPMLMDLQATLGHPFVHAKNGMNSIGIQPILNVLNVIRNHPFNDGKLLISNAVRFVFFSFILLNIKGKFLKLLKINSIFQFCKPLPLRSGSKWQLNSTP